MNYLFIFLLNIILLTNDSNNYFVSSSSLGYKSIKYGIDLYEDIVNPDRFKYLTNPGKKFCAENTFLLIVVNTEPGRLANRNLIGET